MRAQVADTIIVNDDNKVLLVQQRKDSAYMLWSYPSGQAEGVEQNRTLGFYKDARRQG